MGTICRYSKLLRSQVTRKPQEQKPTQAPYEWINWANANLAGIFTNANVDELEASYEKACSRVPTDPKPSQRGPTVRSASREDVLLALHKAKA